MSRCAGRALIALWPSSPRGNRACALRGGCWADASRLAPRPRLACSIRLRRQTSYTTIALVSALLAGVSFLAYATPPAQLFSAAGGSAAADALAPTPAPQGHHHPTKSQWQEWSHDAVVITYKVMFDIYGVGAFGMALWCMRCSCGYI